MRGRKVELLVSCTDLADVDEFSKSDPMCVLFIKQFGQWKEFARTEPVRESLNPKFTETFILEYDPEVPQQLMFSVYDIDSRSTNLHHHDYVGSVEMLLSEVALVDVKIKTLTKSLRMPGDPKSRGLISVTCETVQESRSKLSLHVGAHKLDKRGMLSLNKPDTFLEISRSIDSISYHAIHRTEIVHRSQHPRWRPFDLSVQKLCNDDWDRSVMFSCWHFSSNSNSYELIGQYITTLREIHSRRNNENKQHAELIHPKKEKKRKDSLTSDVGSFKKSKKHGITGFLKFYSLRVDLQYSLMDYVRGGCRIKLMIAIDFTASNGGIDENLSLHNIQNIEENQYLRAISTLGSMILRYDVEQEATVYGFGAKFKKNTPVNHCFPLSKNNNNTDMTWVKGIKTISDLYQQALPSLIFAGPTKYTPIISKAMELASQSKVTQDNQVYHVLMVITDTVLNDLDETVECLVKSSCLPLSVVIVGVGPADFGLIEHIHPRADQPLQCTNSKVCASRNNVHFAAFRKDTGGTGVNMAVAREALAAVSKQMTEYMKESSLRPNQPVMRKSNPSKTWVDKGDLEEEDDTPIFSLSRKLSGSVKRLSQSNSSIGPTCPTCGSFIESESQLFGDAISLT